MQLWSVAVMLFALWMLGLLTSHRAYGSIHMLLGLAIVLALVSFLQRRRLM